MRTRGLENSRIRELDNSRTGGLEISKYRVLKFSNHLILPLIIILIFLSPAAMAFEEKLSDPKQEEMALDIFKRIRCSVCEGQSVYDSNSRFSIDMRLIVRTMIKEGKTEPEILQELERIYGDGVVSGGSFSSRKILIYLGLPIAVLIAGLITLQRNKLKV